MEDVLTFIANIENETRRSDSLVLLSLLHKVSGYNPYLSGNIIGFGQYHYKYDSGLEGDSGVISFSPRKQSLVVYIMPGFNEFDALLKELGKHKLGKSCLYINKLSDINLDILEQIAELAVNQMQHKYKCKNI